MSRRTNIGLIVGFIAALVVAAALAATALAQTKGPKPQDKLGLAEEQAKHLLLLIDTEKRGRISKQEWMRFTEAEF
jgi:hypothetical protein